MFMSTMTIKTRAQGTNNFLPPLPANARWVARRGNPCFYLGQIFRTYPFPFPLLPPFPFDYSLRSLRSRVLVARFARESSPLATLANARWLLVGCEGYGARADLNSRSALRPYAMNCAALSSIRDAIMEWP